MTPQTANRHGRDPRTEPEDQGTLVAGDGADADKNKKDVAPDAVDDAVESSGPVAGGDKSDRAARSGATGERNPEGAASRPEPKDQDEKGMGVRRNP